MAQDGAGAAGPRRVVILGGGAAGVAAAYWLSRPEQNGAYQVSLYTQGWRLGGKCASGRNAAIAQRIEEHGLHMLMGCYQNAFATLRACYLDWRALKPDPTSPFQTWTDAFLPQRLISLMDQDGPGNPPAWAPWNFPFPQLPGEPGDGPLVPGSDMTDDLPAEEGMIIRLSQWLQSATPFTAPYYASMVSALNAVRGVFITAAADTSQAQAALQQAAAEVHPAIDGGASATTAGLGTTLSRLAILADLGLAVSFGYLRDLYMKGPNAWDALNTQDFRAWLGGCGASQTSLTSGPINAFYDL
ncbi:MAG: NAD(P)-binding protein, partial [Caulobacteraceae bacterium]|nr:NAD(P)-binding protein [Caulobacteraceae bacterium]